jgi:hypothetical protein
MNSATKIKEYGFTVTEGIGSYGVIGSRKINHPGDHSIGFTC